MELLALLNALWRRRGTVVASVTLFVVTAVCASALMPSTYSATTQVMVAGEDSTASLLNDLGLSEMAMSLTNSDDIQNKIYLATSKPVMQEVIWRLQLRDGSGRLYEHDDIGDAGLLQPITGTPSVVITQIQGTDILEIEATGTSPEAARLMADTLAQVYIDRTTDQARTETREARRFIQQQLALVTEELDSAFGRIAAAQRDSAIIDLDSEVRAAVSRLSELMLEQEQVAAKIQETRARIRSAQAFRTEEGVTGVSATTMSSNPVIGEQRRKLADLRTQRDALLANGYTAIAPEVKRLDAQIASVEREIGAALAEMTTLDPTVAGLDADLAALQERAQELDAGITRTTDAFASYPDKMREISKLELAASAAEAVYRSLQDQNFQIGIAEAMTMSDVRVVATASLPDKPASPKVLLNLVAALVLGLVFGSGSALALEYFDDSIRTAEDLRAAWDAPQLGVLPRYKPGRVPALADLPPTDPLVEAHRTVRNSIGFASLDKPLRLLGVTSSAPGEGKSTFAMNLALSMASEGRRVLLVDADLRLPTQHRMFPELVSAPGLVEVLSREVEPRDAIQRAPIENLDVLAAGDIPRNPAHLVESLRLRQVLLELGRGYDVIVVDSPPVLAVTDPVVLGRFLDGLVVLVEANATTRRMLAETRSRFEAAQVQPLGLVLNKVPPSAQPYGVYTRYYQRAAQAQGPTPPARKGGAA